MHFCNIASPNALPWVKEAGICDEKDFQIEYLALEHWRIFILCRFSGVRNYHLIKGFLRCSLIRGKNVFAQKGR